MNWSRHPYIHIREVTCIVDVPQVKGKQILVAFCVVIKMVIVN